MMLKEKSIVIVGGTTGIGFSAAKAFIAQGARVLIIGHEEKDCVKAAENLGSSCLAVCADAREEKATQEAIRNCQETFGSFDGLYHVAGGSGRKFGDGPLHEMTFEGWQKTLELNLTSIMLSNQAAVKVFMENKTAGSILNVSSVLAYSPSPNYFTTHAYATAKAAIIGFSQAIAAYYSQHNIRINVLAPGLVATPMSARAQSNEDIMDFVATKQPLDGGRIAQPEDLDGIASYFMSDQSRFTTGQVIAVDGGWALSDGQI